MHAVYVAWTRCVSAYLRRPRCRLLWPKSPCLLAFVYATARKQVDWRRLAAAVNKAAGGAPLTTSWNGKVGSSHLSHRWRGLTRNISQRKRRMSCPFPSLFLPPLLRQKHKLPERGNPLSVLASFLVFDLAGFQPFLGCSFQRPPNQEPPSPAETEAPAARQLCLFPSSSG